MQRSRSSSAGSPGHALSSDPRRWLPVALAVLALDTVVLALLGPLAFGVIHYRVSPLLRDQLIGSDAVSLLVIAPLGLLAAWLVRRRSPAGPLLALGTAAASWYLVAELVLGPDRSLPGNDELFLPLFLGILLLAATVVAGAWRAALRDDVTLDGRRRTRIAWYLLALVALFVVGRYLPTWLSITQGRPPADYLAGPQVWWTVAFEDLALLLPALAAAGIGLLRAARWATPALFASAGCLALIGTAVTGMAWSTTLHGDAGSSVATALTMTAIGLISAGPVLLAWAGVVRFPALRGRSARSAGDAPARERRLDPGSRRPPLKPAPAGRAHRSEAARKGTGASPVGS